MTTPTPRMSAKQFERVASEACRRWETRTLDVARALLVGGVPLSEAAEAHDMSRQQAAVVRRRFLAKAEKMRMDSFMAREQPKLTAAALEPFAQDMRTLRDKGYTMPQIVAYLRENGVETSVTSVRNFLKE